MQQGASDSGGPNRSEQVNAESMGVEKAFSVMELVHGMQQRTIVAGSLALLIAFSGCAGVFAPDQPTTEPSGTPSTTTVGPTTTEATVSFEATHVVIVSSESPDPTNVTVELNPDDGDARTHSFTLTQDEDRAFPHEAYKYVITVRIENEPVLENVPVPNHRYHEITIHENGTVTTREIEI